MQNPAQEGSQPRGAPEPCSAFAPPRCGYCPLCFAKARGSPSVLEPSKLGKKPPIQVGNHTQRKQLGPSPKRGKEGCCPVFSPSLKLKQTALCARKVLGQAHVRGGGTGPPGAAVTIPEGVKPEGKGEPKRASRNPSQPPATSPRLQAASPLPGRGSQLGRAAAAKRLQHPCKTFDRNCFPSPCLTENEGVCQH